MLEDAIASKNATMVSYDIVGFKLIFICPGTDIFLFLVSHCEFENREEFLALLDTFKPHHDQNNDQGYANDNDHVYEY